MLANVPLTTILPVVDLLGSEKAAWFSDSGGNILCLHEDLA